MDAACGRRQFLVVAGGFAGGLLAAGCAGLDPAALRARTEGKSVAVGSVFGSTVTLRWLNRQRLLFVPIEVSDWRFDSELVSTVRLALVAAGRVGAVEPLERLTASAAGRPEIPFGLSSELLLVVGAGGPAEPGTRFDPSSVLGFPGVGVYQRTGLDGTTTELAHLGLRLRLFERQAGRLLGEADDVVEWPLDIASITSARPSYEFGQLPPIVLSPIGMQRLEYAVAARMRPLVDALLARIGMV